MVEQRPQGQGKPNESKDEVIGETSLTGDGEWAYGEEKKGENPAAKGGESGGINVRTIDLGEREIVRRSPPTSLNQRRW